MRNTFLTLMGLFLLAGCGKQGPPPVPSPLGEKDVTRTEEYAKTDEASEGGAQKSAAPSGGLAAGKDITVSTSTGSEITLPERMVAYTVYWEMETEKFNQVADRLTLIPEKYNGYIVSSNVYKTENMAWNANIIMKVPADRLTEVENEIKGIQEAKVISYNKTSQDVTEEYLDLSIRLENKKHLLDRMRALLLKANSVYEAMQVENEIARITEDIERMEGRMRFLQNITSYSQIQIILHEPYPTPLGQEGGPLKIIKRSIEVAVTLFTYVIAAMVVIAGGLLPLVILALIIWLIIWGIVRSKRKKGAKAAG
jgi:predicted small lipoprotein YifL